MNLDMTQVVAINLLGVEKLNNLLVIQREMVFSDGTTNTGKHVLPEDTLEWRAAEYGIDPADLNALLDIVLWEPFLEEDDRPDLALYSADTVEAARTHYLARIQRAKARGGATPQVAKPDPVRDQILAMVVVHPEAIAIKEAMVGKVRGRMRAEREAVTKARLRALVVPGASQEDLRLDRLKAMLNADRPTREGKTRNG